MKEWLRKHWKVLAAVGAGAIGLYLLWQRSQSAGGGAPSADAGNGLPSTGPAPVDTGAPPQYLNPGEQAAAAYASQLAQQPAIPGENPAAIRGVQSNGQPWSLGTLQQELVSDYEAATGGQLPPSINTNAALPPSSEQLASDYLTRTGQEPPGWHNYPGQGQGTAPKFTLGNVLAGNVQIPIVSQVLGAIGGASQGVPISSSEAQAYGNADIGQVPAPSVSPVPLGPPAPQATGQQAMVASAPSHGPTTPAGIPNHAVGVH